MRFKITREMYVGGMKKIEKDGIPAIVYFEIKDNGIPHAMGFVGKKAKPVFNYTFRNDTQMNEYVEKFFKATEVRFEDKIRARKEAKEFKTSLKVGDIMVASWGWEQTNINFFQVTGIMDSKKSVYLREIGQKDREMKGFMSGTTMPDIGNFVGGEFRKKVSKGDYINLTSYKGLHKWDGKPENWTAYA